MNTDYIKITVVTPVFNQVDYIEQTLLSVLSQGYSNLEYIIIDGGSTDGTVDIIKKYESQISRWISEPDSGMYHALNKGFNMSTGSIMCWVNSDDILLPNSLSNMARLFNDLPEVSWIQGLNGFIDLQSRIINTDSPKKFSFLKFLNNDFKWIQQESTFWRRSLWETAGGKVDDNLKLAGDFELWFRFFQHEKLYNSKIPIGAWRRRKGQLSSMHLDAYYEEAFKTINSYPKNKQQLLTLRKIKYLQFLIKVLRKLQIFNLQRLINIQDTYLQIQHIDIRYSHRDNKFLVKLK